MYVVSMVKINADTALAAYAALAAAQKGAECGRCGGIRCWDCGLIESALEGLMNETSLSPCGDDEKNIIAAKAMIEFGEIPELFVTSINVVPSPPEGKGWNVLREGHGARVMVREVAVDVEFYETSESIQRAVIVV